VYPFPSGHTTGLVSMSSGVVTGLSYLYACVLRSQVYSVVVGGVGHTEDVTDVIGRPERIQVLEGRGAPDLDSQHTSAKCGRGYQH